MEQTVTTTVETVKERKRKSRRKDKDEAAQILAEQRAAELAMPRVEGPKTIMAVPPQFDFKDVAPEDRTQNTCKSGNHNNWPWSTGLLRPHDPIVTGSFHITGVNYSRYENAKCVPKIALKFQRAISEDIVSEVGGGTRVEDVILRLTPGAIDNVVLHYHNNPTEHNRPPTKLPKLMDAKWRIKVDYVIKSRDVSRQQQTAIALYNALTSGYNMANKTATAYVKYLDPDHDPAAVQIIPKESLKPPKGAGSQKQPPNSTGLSSPPRATTPLAPPQAAGMQQHHYHQPQYQVAPQQVVSMQPVSMQPLPQPQPQPQPAPVPVRPSPTQVPVRPPVMPAAQPLVSAPLPSPVEDAGPPSIPASQNPPSLQRGANRSGSSKPAPSPSVRGATLSTQQSSAAYKASVTPPPLPPKPVSPKAKKRTLSPLAPEKPLLQPKPVQSQPLQAQPPPPQVQPPPPTIQPPPPQVQLQSQPQPQRSKVRTLSPKPPPMSTQLNSPPPPSADSSLGIGAGASTQAPSARRYSEPDIMSVTPIGEAKTPLPTPYFTYPSAGSMPTMHAHRPYMQDPLYTDVLSDLRKDAELEMLSLEIDKERSAIASSLRRSGALHEFG